LEDISSAIADYLENAEFDDKKADKLESRLDKIRVLKRKYGGSVAAVTEFLRSARAEYDKLSQSAEQIEALQKRKDAAEDSLYRAASALSGKRGTCAAMFERVIVSELSELGMKNAKFSVRFQAPYGRENFIAHVNAEGADAPEFYFSANPGVPEKPLAVIISGGEMSRFMLALKNVVADGDTIGTMIFDEIDAGISGKIGQAVAEKLARISRRHQVICITHLPVIAAMADHHYLIEKKVSEDDSVSTLTELSESGRLDEIARLSGGKDISSAALTHAREMKAYCDKYKAESV
jgi:DNA repair protein RecN (Recombination protein N)